MYQLRSMMMLVVATVAVSVVGALELTVAHDATPAADDSGSYLFVQSGFTEGRFDATSEEGVFVLVLEGAPAQTVFFSERPARVAGAVATQTFLDSLDFSADPPNAALVISVGDEETDVIVVELTEPAYDPDAETITFVATLLFDSKAVAGLGVADQPLGAAEIPLTFGPSSLFIDYGCSPLDPRGC